MFKRPQSIEPSVLTFCEPYGEIGLDVLCILLSYAYPLIDHSEKLLDEHNQDENDKRLVQLVIQACKGPWLSLFKQLALLRKYEASARGLGLKIKEQMIQDKGAELCWKNLLLQQLTESKIQAKISDWIIPFPNELKTYAKGIYGVFLSFPFLLENDIEHLPQVKDQVLYLDQVIDLYHSIAKGEHDDKLKAEELGLLPKTTLNELYQAIQSLRYGKIGALHLLWQDSLMKKKSVPERVSKTLDLIVAILQSPALQGFQQQIKAQAQAEKKQEQLKAEAEKLIQQQVEAQIEAQIEEKIQAPAQKKVESFKVIHHITPKKPQSLVVSPQPQKIQSPQSPQSPQVLNEDDSQIDFSTHLTSPIERLDLSIEPQATPLPGMGENVGTRMWRIEERLSSLGAIFNEESHQKAQEEESRTWKVRFRKGSLYRNGALKWIKADWSIYHTTQKPSWLEDQLNQQGNLLKLLSLDHINLPNEWGWDEKSNRYYLISHLLSGPSLEDYVKKMEIINDQEIIKMLLPCLTSLNTLHLMGIAHGNIKKSNLIFNEKSLFLSDFHLITSLFPGGSKEKRQNQIDHIAPEIKKQYELALMKRKSNQSQDTPYHFTSVLADLFSIGKLLLSLLSKQQQLSDLDHHLQMLVTDLLQVQPEKRPSLQTVIDSLKAYVDIPNPENDGTTTDATMLVDQQKLVKPIAEFQSSNAYYGQYHLDLGDCQIELVYVPAPMKNQAPFLISSTPITQIIWTKIMGQNHSIFSGALLPMDSVSYLDALSFCEKLNQNPLYLPPQLDLAHFDLPTLEQWQFCAKAGQVFQYAGSAQLDEVGWFVENAGGLLQKVGQKKANAWGLFDMSGNIWEWTKSDDEQSADSVGGSWIDSAEGCRIVSKRKLKKDFKSLDQGFRMILQLPKP